jgi:hypothetical protein
MRYLTLAADYGELSLQDEQLGTISVRSLDVPARLVEDLVAWNDRYQEIVPLGIAERARDPAAAVISELDRLGVHLAQRLAVALTDAKVRYYSEGLLRYVA